MSHLIRCDHCTAELDEYHDTYFTVERDGISMAAFGEVPGPWNFCTWYCMSAYASAANEREHSDS